MQTGDFKTICINAIKPLIGVDKKRCIVENETNLRLWWKEGNKTCCVVIVYDLPETLEKAAILFKECKLIDHYQTIRRDNQIVNVLLQKVDPTEKVAKQVKLNELKLSAVSVLDIASEVVYSKNMDHPTDFKQRA